MTATVTVTVTVTGTETGTMTATVMVTVTVAVAVTDALSAKEDAGTKLEQFLECVDTDRGTLRR